MALVVEPSLNGTQLTCQRCMTDGIQYKPSTSSLRVYSPHNICSHTSVHIHHSATARGVRIRSTAPPRLTCLTLAHNASRRVRRTLCRTKSLKLLPTRVALPVTGAFPFLFFCRLEYGKTPFPSAPTCPPGSPPSCPLHEVSLALHDHHVCHETRGGGQGEKREGERDIQGDFRQGV